MNLIVTTLVVVALASAALGSQLHLQAEFAAWKAKFGVSYETEAEHAMRLGVFAQNKVRAAELNAEAEMGEYGLTKFADLSPKEFRSLYLSSGPVVRPAGVPEMPLATPAEIAATPASVDWRTHNPPVVTPVKNQGQCGSCWSFSTTGALEGAWALAGNPLVSLSEQQLVSCSHNCIEYEGQKSCNAGCNGGLQSAADEYIIGNKGIQSEADYPYIGADTPCNADPSKNVAHMANYTMVPKDADTIASVCAQYGPLAIAADAAIWQYYIGGVVETKLCGDSLDHGILIVGYGMHKNLIGKEVPVWIIKNSWGAAWGDKGYLYVLRGEDTCGVENYVSRPIVA